MTVSLVERADGRLFGLAKLAANPRSLTLGESVFL